MDRSKAIDLDKRYDSIEESLLVLNKELYDEPELGYLEFKSVEKIKNYY